MKGLDVSVVKDIYILLLLKVVHFMFFDLIDHFVMC